VSPSGKNLRTGDKTVPADDWTPMLDNGAEFNNGLNDGWHRPPGAAPVAHSAGNSSGDFHKLGIALHSRYWVFWVIANPNRAHLRFNFDTIGEAAAYVAEKIAEGYQSGGVWDRRKNRWAL